MERNRCFSVEYRNEGFGDVEVLGFIFVIVERVFIVFGFRLLGVG